MADQNKIVTLVIKAKSTADKALKDLSKNLKKTADQSKKTESVISKSFNKIKTRISSVGALKRVRTGLKQIGDEGKKTESRVSQAFAKIKARAASLGGIKKVGINIKRIGAEAKGTGAEGSKMGARLKSSFKEAATGAKEFLKPVNLAKLALKGIAVVGAAVAGVFIGAVKGFADLQESAKFATIQLKLTSKELKAVQNEIRSIAKQTGVSKANVGEIFDELVNAGATAAEAMVGARAAAQGLTGILEKDFAEATKQAAAVVTNFNLSLSQFPVILDKLLVASNKQADSFVRFSDGVRDVGTLLGTMGVSANEAIAVVTTISERNGEASKAASEFESNMEALRFKLAEVGASNFIDFIRILKDRFTDATGAVKEFQLIEFLGTDDIKNIQILIEEFDSLEQNLKDVADAAGEAGRLFTEASKLINVQWAKIKERVHDVFVELGQRLEPEIRAFTNFAPGAIDGVATAFARLIEGVGESTDEITSLQRRMDEFAIHTEFQMLRLADNISTAFTITGKVLEGIFTLSPGAAGTNIVEVFSAANIREVGRGTEERLARTLAKKTRGATGTAKNQREQIGEEFKAGRITEEFRDTSIVQIEKEAISSLEAVSKQLRESGKFEDSFTLDQFEREIENRVAKLQLLEDAAGRKVKPPSAKKPPPPTADEKRAASAEALAKALEAIANKFDQIRVNVGDAFSTGQITEYEKGVKLLQADLQEIDALLGVSGQKQSVLLGLQLQKQQVIQQIAKTATDEQLRAANDLLASDRKSIALKADQERLDINRLENVSETVRQAKLLNVGMMENKAIMEALQRAEEATAGLGDQRINTATEMLALSTDRLAIEKEIEQAFKDQFIELANGLALIDAENQAKSENIKGRQAALSEGGEIVTREDLIEQQRRKEQAVREGAKAGGGGKLSEDVLNQELAALDEINRKELARFDIKQKQFEIATLMADTELNSIEAQQRALMLRQEIEEIGAGLSKEEQLGLKTDTTAAAEALRASTETFVFDLEQNVASAIEAGLSGGDMWGTFTDNLKKATMKGLAESLASNLFGGGKDSIFGGGGAAGGGGGLGGMLSGLVGGGKGGGAGGGGGLLGSILGGGGGGALAGIGGAISSAIPFIGAALLAKDLLFGGNPAAASSTGSQDDPRFGGAGIAGGDRAHALIGSEAFTNFAFSSSNEGGARLGQSAANRGVEVDVNVKVDAGPEFATTVESSVVKGNEQSGNFGNRKREI